MSVAANITDVPNPTVLQNEFLSSQIMELLVSDDEDGNVANSRFYTMTELRYEKRVPETRFNYGTERSYAYGAPDFGIRFTLHGARSLLAFVTQRSTPNVRNVYPVYKYFVKFTANDGSSETLPFNAYMLDLDFIKPENAQEDPIGIRCLLRIIDRVQPTPISKDAPTTS